jgi:RHS repeat-associated protein
MTDPQRAVSFKYDSFGRRIGKSSPRATSVYSYDGNNLVEETNSSGTVVARYSQGLNIDEPLAMLRSGATSYFHADGLGSVTSLSSAAGSIAQTYTFDSFGNQTGSSGSLTNSFRYTAREFDAETSLYYYRARYYDPNPGRFLSEDASRQGSLDVVAWNFYSYVSNDAVNSIDPLGLYQLQGPLPGHVPPLPPSPALDRKLTCLEHCYGASFIVTSTSEVVRQHKPGTPHRRGEAADISYPANPSKMLCCAAQCGFKFALDEKLHPSPGSTGAHIHVQFTRGWPWQNGGYGDLPKGSPCPCKGTGEAP